MDELNDIEMNEIKQYYNRCFREGISVKLVNVKKKDDSIAILDLDQSNIWIISITLANKLLAKSVNKKKRLKYLESIREDFLKQQSLKIGRIYEIDEQLVTGEDIVREQPKEVVRIYEINEDELLTVESFWEFVTEKPQTSKEILAPFTSGKKKAFVKVSKKTSPSSSRSRSRSPSPSTLPSSSTVTTKTTREQLGKRPRGKRILNFREKRPKISYETIDSTDDESCSLCNSPLEELDTDDDKQPAAHSFCNSCERIVVHVEELSENKSPTSSKNLKPDEESQNDSTSSKKESSLDDDNQEMIELDYNFKITEDMDENDLRNAMSKFTNHEKTRDDVYFAYKVVELLQWDSDFIRTKSITLQGEETDQQKLRLHLSDAEYYPSHLSRTNPEFITIFEYHFLQNENLIPSQDLTLCHSRKMLKVIKFFRYTHKEPDSESSEDEYPSGGSLTEFIASKSFEKFDFLHLKESNSRVSKALYEKTFGELLPQLCENYSKLCNQLYLSTMIPSRHWDRLSARAEFFRLYDMKIKFYPIREVENGSWTNKEYIDKFKQSDSHHTEEEGMKLFKYFLVFLRILKLLKINQEYDLNNSFENMSLKERMSCFVNTVVIQKILFFIHTHFVRSKDEPHITHAMREVFSIIRNNFKLNYDYSAISRPPN